MDHPRVFIILILFTQLIQLTTPTDIISPLLIAELLKEARLDLAPFKKTALERLHGAIFGTGRAARSTDIVIFNMSDYRFKLRENGCETGGWTSSLLPEFTIPAHSSVIFGAESHGFLQGVTNCRLRYKSRNREASFQITTSNPYIGRHRVNANGDNVQVHTVLGKGTNNIVKFTVSPIWFP